MRPFMPPPTPAPPSPLEWGKQERVFELFGKEFDLRIETGTTVLRMPPGEHVWPVFSEGYGPTKMLHRTTDRKDDLRRDFIAFHDAHRTEPGVAPRDYLVVIGNRR
jgi:hypothetical protein